MGKRRAAALVTSIAMFGAISLVRADGIVKTFTVTNYGVPAAYLAVRFDTTTSTTWS